ncbi:MAG: hypothetical protein ACW9XB_05145 [Candidatus Nitrosopumilus sp. metabat.KBP569_Feb_25m_nospike.7]
MNQRVVWIVVIVSFLVTSIVVLTYTNHPIHREIHTISMFLAMFLAILAFKAYVNYRITRLLFSAFAFLAFGISESIETIYEPDYHEEPFGMSEIRDYVIIAGLSLFAMGTIPKKEK